MKAWYNKIFLCLLFLLLVYGCFRFGKILRQRLNLQQDEKINIFILGGQSNMAGRGGVVRHIWDKYIPIECMEDERIFRLNGNCQLEIAKEPLHEGVDFPNKTCGIGPGIPFAHAVLERDPDFGVIILVPSAAGGTGILDWSAENSWVRNRMVARAKEALKFGGRIRGILWYQGETETSDEFFLPIFLRKYKLFLARLYEELGHPNVPFIQVALASGDPGKGTVNYMQTIREHQFKMGNVVTVDALGLALGPDNIHLTSTAQVRLGDMMAEAFFKSIE